MATKNTKTEVKERPILFSGAMVRAILEGRKTQTRRECKFTSAGHLKATRSHKRWHPEDPEALQACPYGLPGDRLWVRERFALSLMNGCIPVQGPPSNAEILGPSIHFCATQQEESLASLNKWRPSIHMPRWASRITLEIVSIRVERLQDISEADAKVEGADPYNAALDIGTKGTPRLDAGPFQKGYALLWGQISGPGSWCSNPWVWVVEFNRVEAEVKK